MPIIRMTLASLCLMAFKTKLFLTIEIAVIHDLVYYIATFLPWPLRSPVEVSCGSPYFLASHY